MTNNQTPEEEVKKVYDPVLLAYYKEDFELFKKSAQDKYHISTTDAQWWGTDGLIENVEKALATGFQKDIHDAIKKCNHEMHLRDVDFRHKFHVCIKSSSDGTMLPFYYLEPKKYFEYFKIEEDNNYCWVLTPECLQLIEGLFETGKYINLFVAEGFDPLLNLIIMFTHPNDNESRLRLTQKFIEKGGNINMQAQIGHSPGPLVRFHFNNIAPRPGTTALHIAQY